MTNKSVSLDRWVKFWPTPRVADTEGGIVKNVEMKDGTFSRVNKQGVRWGVKLKDAVDHAEKMWPTPRAQDSKHGAATEWELNTDHAGTRDSLRVQVVKRGAMWPTPTVQDSANDGGPSQWKRNTPPLNVAVKDSLQVTGQLNPTWVEWLMGWPLGWTDLKPLETDKYQQWLQQHGCC